MGRAKTKAPARVKTPPASWLPVLGICLLPLLAYSNSLGGALVLDSKQLIVADPRIRAFTAENLDLIVRHSYWWPYGESGLYRPVTTLSYLFNYAVLGNGERPAGYHAVNLLLHIVNCVLVLFMMRRLLDPRAAVIAAAIWSVLPLSVEAVTNIPGRADLLATMAVLSGILLYARSREAAGWRRRACLAAVAAFATLGNFSKESAIVLLPVLLLLEWTMWWAPGSGRRSWRAFAAVAPSLIVMLLARRWVFAGAPQPEFAFLDNPIAHADFWSGRLTALRVTGHYLQLLVWPWRLSHDYSYAQIPPLESSIVNWSAALLALSACAAVAWRFRHRRDALFAAAFAVVAFAPVSNLVIATGTIMAERLMYLPSIGLVALFAIVLGSTVGRRHAAAAAGIAGMVVLAFGVRTYARNLDWQSDLTLWQSAVTAVPNSAKAHRGLAEAIYESDPGKARIDVVIEHAETSVKLLEGLDDRINSFQDHRQAAAYHLDRANLLRDQGGSESALDSWRRARHLLERCLAIFDAGAADRTAVNLASKADAYRLLAAADLGLGDFASAEHVARQALQIAPLHPLGYQLATEALLRLDRFDEAAVTLASGALSTGDQQLGTALIDLYRTAASGSCAVVSIANAPALNPKCPTVRAHVCAAVTSSREVLQRAGRSDRLGDLRQVTTAFACAGGDGGR